MLDTVNNTLLSHRSLVEIVFDELKNLCQIEHSSYRSMTGFQEFGEI